MGTIRVPTRHGRIIRIEEGYEAGSIIRKSRVPEGALEEPPAKERPREVLTPSSFPYRQHQALDIIEALQAQIGVFD